MALWLVTFEPPTIGYLSHHRLRGQQWAVEGHILKWDDWLNLLGLQTMYKLTRVRGRYLRAEDEYRKKIHAGAGCMNTVHDCPSLALFTAIRYSPSPPIPRPSKSTQPRSDL